MPDLCGDKQNKKKQKKCKKWVGQAHTVEKVGGPLAHTVPPPVTQSHRAAKKYVLNFFFLCLLLKIVIVKISMRRPK